MPKVEYGIRIDVSYKSFDLSVFGSGVAGKTGFDPTKFFNSFVNVRNNFGPATLNAWTPQNTSSTIPALSVLNHNGEDRTYNFYFVDASYFKLRNVLLGYNLPKNIVSKIKMESLRKFRLTLYKKFLSISNAGHSISIISIKTPEFNNYILLSLLKIIFLLPLVIIHNHLIN